MEKYIRLFYIVLLKISLLALIQCNSKPQIRPVEETRIMMDTFVTITIYDPEKPEERVEEIIRQAFEVMTNVDSLANNYNEHSRLSMINREAGSRFIEIDPDLVYLIEQSIDVAKISDGAFDITIEPLIKVWSFEEKEPQIPALADIERALLNVDYNDIIMNNNNIKFNNDQLKIDLSGIAKGFSVDKAMELMISRGVHDALINAGGDIRAICSGLTKGRRKVWIRHPRQKEKLYGYFPMDDGSVATSGDYERFFVVDSVRYHHILDPNSGYPARNCVSVTIMAKNTTMADALATAVFVKGSEQGMELINQLDGVEGVILFYQNDSLTHSVSEGLRDGFQLNDKVN